jgi:Fe-S cluster assembly protein SufD
MAPLFDGIDRLRLVFVDGVFDAAASDDLALEGCRSTRCPPPITGRPLGRRLYGTLETSGRTGGASLRGAEHAGARDGVLIRVTGKPARPSTSSTAAPRRADVYFHHVIRLEPGPS